MSINIIDKNIQTNQLAQGRTNEATSGKKEQAQTAEIEAKKVSLADSIVFSEDAQKLQETEVILRNALLMLKEMDEVTESTLKGIRERVENKFYDNAAVANKVAGEIVPENELAQTARHKALAEQYTIALNEIDSQNHIDHDKLALVRERIDSGYYNSREVAERIAKELVDLL
jgi:hypothetical protein